MSVDKRAIRKSLRTNFNPGPRDAFNRVMLRGRQATRLPALLAGGKLDRPIFIIGAPRSGTSMLYAILREHPRLSHWPGEAHEVWEADYHPALTGWRSNQLTEADYDEEAAERIRRSFFLVAGSKRRLVDKTPRNALRIRFIERLFTDAHFVYLQRDGRDNVNSLINAWRTPRYRTYELSEPHAIAGADPRWWKFVLYPGWEADRKGPLEVVCANQWVASNHGALEGRAVVGADRWVEVSYETFVEDPESGIDRILDGLDLASDPGVRAKAQAARSKPVNIVTPPERGKWKRENPVEIRAILPSIRSTMEELGYPVDEH